MLYEGTVAPFDVISKSPTKLQGRFSLALQAATPDVDLTAFGLSGGGGNRTRSGDVQGLPNAHNRPHQKHSPERNRTFAMAV